MLNLQLWATSALHRFNNAVFNVGAKPDAITELTTHIFLAKNYSVNLGIGLGVALGCAVGTLAKASNENILGSAIAGAGVGYVAGHIAGVELAIRNVQSLKMKNEISPKQGRILQVIALGEGITCVLLAAGALAIAASK